MIHKFNGHEVKNFPMLRSLVAQAELNKKVELEIMRGGKSLNVATQIKEQPVDYQTTGVLPRQAQPQTPPEPKSQPETNSPLASIHVADLSPEMARQLDLPSNVQGVVVTSVDPDSGAAELQKGDVIEEINQQPVPSISDYNKMVASLDPSQSQVLSVCRHRMRSFPSCGRQTGFGYLCETTQYGVASNLGYDHRAFPNRKPRTFVKVSL